MPRRFAGVLRVVRSFSVVRKADEFLKSLLRPSESNAEEPPRSDQPAQPSERPNTPQVDRISDRLAAGTRIRIPLGKDSWLILRCWNGHDAMALRASWVPGAADKADEVHVRRCSALAGCPDAIVLTIDREHGRPLGTLTFYRTSDRHWSVGYWVLEPWRRHGIASAALTAATPWAFTMNPHLLRISLFARPDNVASHRVAERAGYRREGLLRRWLESEGTLKDVLMFSSVRDDHQP